jgi:hypothetical protein
MLRVMCDCVFSATSIGERAEPPPDFVLVRVGDCAGVVAGENDASGAGSLGLLLPPICYPQSASGRSVQVVKVMMTGYG